MSRNHHLIKTATALCAIAAASLVAGCGGSASSSTAGGVNIVRAAFVSSRAAGYQIAVKLTENAAGQTINATGTGAFAPAAHAGSLTLNVSVPALGSETFPIDALILGNDFYLKFPASLAGKIPGGKPWLELNLFGKPAGIHGLSSLTDNPAENPAQFLQFLRAAATGSVRNLGKLTIDGVSTTGVRATVDLSKVVETLPAPQRQSAASAIASIEKLTGLHNLPIEAWVDSSDHVRRTIVSETGDFKGHPFTEKIELDFVKYGPEPVPAAPATDDVTNITSLLGTL